MDSLTVTEQLLLLLTKDKGTLETWNQNGHAMRAAAVTDLLVSGALTVGEEKDPVVGVTGEPAGHPHLEPLLERISGREKKRQRTLKAIIGDYGVDPTEDVVESLRSRGILGLEKKRMLGLVPERRPTLQPSYEREVRAGLARVIAGGQPTPDEAALLAILQAMGVAGQILREEKGDLSASRLKARITEASREVKAGAALASTIETMNLIMLTTVIVPAVTTTAT